MEPWSVFPQSTHTTPNSTWLCNTPGSEWLHSQNHATERERSENTAALATPTRYIIEEYNVNQNSSSGSYYNPYDQEMDRIFENNFLKIGNPEVLLNNDIYNNDWLNTNENVIPITTTASDIIIPPTTSNIPSTNAPHTTTNVTNSPTPSLITDDGQDQLYNNRNSVSTTSASFIQYPITNPTTTTTTTTTTSSMKSSSSPVSSRIVKESHYPMTTSSSTSTFYQETVPSIQQQRLNHDQYLQTKKRDPKQLLLPLTTNTLSMDGNMTVAITSPTSSFATDDDDDDDDIDQRKKKNNRRQSYCQLSNPTNDLPMQQPSPASSEFSSSVKTPPPCNNDTSPKQKKRRVSQRKLNNRRTSKVHEGSLISPIGDSYSEQNGQTVSESGESSPDASNVITTGSNEQNTSESNAKREVPDDGHDEQDETPEEKRSRLLERNRVAAAKCRQKKKQAQESLQQQASDLSQKNTTMHSLVNELREEALKLKNQLLAHSTCNCNVIQEYVRTSGQFAFARPPYTK